MEQMHSFCADDADFVSLSQQIHPQSPDPKKLATSIMREYRVTSADFLAREDITVDQLVDVIVGNRYVLNVMNIIANLFFSRVSLSLATECTSHAATFVSIIDMCGVFILYAILSRERTSYAL